MANAMQMVKLSKGRGLIMSSDVNRKIFMRSPIDAQTLAKALGMSQE